MFDIKTILSTNSLVFVDFYADWCVPCIKFMPQLDILEKKYNNIKFVKINVDENEEIATQYDIVNLPTFLLFKDNILIEKLIGTTQVITTLSKHFDNINITENF